MQINVDLTNVETGNNDGDFETLPEGNYKVIVDTIEHMTEKNYLKWTLNVNGGGYDGRKLWLNTSLKPQALWKLKEVLGRIAPEMDLDGQLNLDTDELIGLPAIAEVEHEEYQGDTKERVEELHAPEDGAGGSNDTDLPV